ncbi:cystatin-A-like [Macrotis lagotis]|uniref:cystatin-A-like n=1 Tax=Macrotis lagotis TaxID=92651 RepID=UPI003D6848E4
MMPGGLSDAKPATPEIQEIVDEIKPMFEDKINGKCETFEAVTYKTQVVAGTMYYVKVFIGNDRYAHLKIIKPLPHTNESPKLLDFQTDKTKDDELTSF